MYVSCLYVLWVASIVDLRVFWQPGSVLFVLNCRDYSLFESNKFLLLLLLLETDNRLTLLKVEID